MNLLSELSVRAEVDPQETTEMQARTVCDHSKINLAILYSTYKNTFVTGDN